MFIDACKKCQRLVLKLLKRKVIAMGNQQMSQMPHFEGCAGDLPMTVEKGIPHLIIKKIVCLKRFLITIIII